MKKYYIMHLSALIIFGTNGIIASHISLQSYQIVLFRTLIGSVVLVLVFLILRRKTAFIKNWHDLMFVSLSGVAMGLSWMLLYEAYSQVGVSIASLLYYSGSVIVMVLSPLIFGERMTLPKITGF